MKRILALVLTALMMLSAMAACNKTPDTPADGTTDPAETTAPAEAGDPDDRKNVKDSLPADFNMKGETVGVLTRNTYRKVDWDGADAVDSDVLAQAVYNRTRAVEDRLGLTFKTTEMELGFADYGVSIEENVLAGDDTWQIILAAGNASIQRGNDHLFHDVSDNRYLDFEREWWAADAMKNISLDGKSIRYMMGDAVMNTYYWSSAAYFNKNIYEENFGDPDALYKKAIAGDWYYDDLSALSEQAANDANGDGQMDEGDVFGMYVDKFNVLGYMEGCTGMQTTVRDENGIPVIEHDTDRGVEILDVLYAYVYETPGVGIDLNRYKTHPDWKTFTDGMALFQFGVLSNTDLDNFRNMKDDYGILPMPKIDEKQQNYVSLITNSATFIVIPKTCADERIGGVIEALSSESYRSVVEVFYESALKTKYSRDSYSGQCIDIIRDTLYKDFMTEYGPKVGCNELLRQLLTKQNKAYVSTYQAQVAAANAKLTEMIDSILSQAE